MSKGGRKIQVPIKCKRNLLTGEVTYEYAEIDEDAFADFFYELYRKSNNKLED